jgi:hypothetical protein
MSLDGFFGRYAELSMGTHPETLASLYAPAFIIGGPQGSKAFTNDAVGSQPCISTVKLSSMNSAGWVTCRRASRIM